MMDAIGAQNRHQPKLTATVPQPGWYKAERSGRQSLPERAITALISQIAGRIRTGLHVRQQTRSWSRGKRFESARRVSSCGGLQASRDDHKFRILIFTPTSCNRPSELGRGRELILASLDRDYAGSCIRLAEKFIYKYYLVNYWRDTEMAFFEWFVGHKSRSVGPDFVANRSERS
jgi:hypothetical protein